MKPHHNNFKEVKILNEYLRTYAQINLDNIEHNLSELKKYSGNAKTCAVIKADGYGHGAVAVGKFLSGKVDFFAVATADEACELRNAGIKDNIIMLSYTHESNMKKMIKAGVSMAVFSLTDAKKMNEKAKETGIKAKIHIAVDTGMKRTGFYPDEKSADDVKEISKLPFVKIEGVFSHYACADTENDKFSSHQKNLFDFFCDLCEKKGVDLGIKHICNSAAITEYSEHYDMVRMGILLYGLWPSDAMDKSKLNIRPAMTFKSHITLIKTVRKGEGISYGLTYTAKENIKVATINAGYADGYPRMLSNKGRVLIHGKYAPVVGIVCMDQIMVDVTDIPEAKVDDEVILFGTDGKNTVSPDEIAGICNTINYEIICGVSRRCPRKYIKDGRETETVNYLV